MNTKKGKCSKGHGMLFPFPLVSVFFFLFPFFFLSLTETSD